MADKDMNNGEIHGYRWSDGTTRHHPEPKVEPRLAKALDAISKLPATPKPEPKLPTPEQYANAYADWVRNYTEWVREFGEWQQKHGRKK